MEDNVSATSMIQLFEQMCRSSVTGLQLSIKDANNIVGLELAHLSIQDMCLQTNVLETLMSELTRANLRSLEYSGDLVYDDDARVIAAHVPNMKLLRHSFENTK